MRRKLLRRAAAQEKTDLCLARSGRQAALRADAEYNSAPQEWMDRRRLTGSDARLALRADADGNSVPQEWMDRWRLAGSGGQAALRPVAE